MHIFQQLLLSTIPVGLVLLVFLPVGGCSSHNDHQNQANTHKIIKQDVSRASHQRAFDITLHGVLLWVSVGFLMPLGILAIRMSNRDECGRTRFKLLFYIHAISQVLAVLLASIGAVLSIKSFENSFNNSHQRIGLALYGGIWVQALAGFRRPKRGTKGRTVWYFFHWILGTTISVAGIFNIYTGLKAYQKRTSRSISLWTILFTSEVSFMGLFYLFQDKWEYIQKQGVILDTAPNTHSDQVLPQRENHKEVLTEPCAKSNALGSYFSRSNALRKLFQLT